MNKLRTSSIIFLHIKKSSFRHKYAYLSLGNIYRVLNIKIKARISLLVRCIELIFGVGFISKKTDNK